MIDKRTGLLLLQLQYNLLKQTTKDDWFYIIHIIQIVYNKFWPQREWIWPHCKFEFITKMFTVSGFYCTLKSGMQFLCKKQGVKLEVGVYF